MALGLLRTKAVDGSVRTAPQKVGGTLTKTVSSQEPGGAMTTIREEPGLLKIQHLISKLLQSVLTSKLAPGSVQMAPLKVPGQ